MPVYTVHEPPRKDDRDDDALAHATRFVFVRDGFHFWAFLLAPLWMLRHRMWLEFIAYLLLTGGITFALTRFGVAGSAGLWVGLLRFACLSLAGISHMKMRARLKLNNSGAARNAVAGKTISSSQRSNPLTVVSLLDAPDHKNVPRWILARGRDGD